MVEAGRTRRRTVLTSIVFAIAVMGLPVTPAILARSGPDFSGTWLMQECDAVYVNPFSRCVLELAQQGDFVDGTATYSDDFETWTCDVRGRVVNGVLEMKWKGCAKYWRGTARMWPHKDGVRGEYLREDVAGTTTQYCRGRRISRHTE